MEGDKEQIIIASDSHRRNDRLAMIRKAYPDADLYLHAGDYTVKDPDQDWIYVQGNNDPAGEEPESRVVPVGEHRIYMVHSHQCKRSRKCPLHLRLAEEAREKGCDIVVYGHSHLPAIDEVDGVLILNPGSVQRAGRGARKGFIVLTLDGGKLLPQFVDWEAFEKNFKPEKTIKPENDPGPTSEGR